MENVKTSNVSVNNNSLWDLTRWMEGTSNNGKQPVKAIASEVRKAVKIRFPFCKFSVTSTYSSIYFNIVSSPFEKESTYLTAIKDYCTKLLESYNYCTCDDPYGDYGSSYKFYGGYARIDYDYIQTENTELVEELTKDFNTKQLKAEQLEEEVKEAKYREYEEKQAEQHKQYLIRQEQEKKELETVNNSIKVIELAEQKQYFIIGSQFANLNKNDTLREYKKEVLKGDYYLQNVKVTKEVHFNTEESLNLFSNLLLNDFDFLQGEQSGGSYTDDNRINSMTDYDNMTEEERKTVVFNLYGVAVYYNNQLQFVIDTQGYSYARYVGLVNNVTIQKDYVTEQTIDAEQLEELKDKADTLEDFSTEIITANDYNNTWNNANWNEYKELLKNKLKINNFKLTKAIIQQISENMNTFKSYMYKLLTEVDGIQEQFKAAEIQQGQKVTMFYILDWGGIITSRIALDKVENSRYAQYDNVVKLTFTPEGKRKQYYNHFYSTMLVYNGWLELPKTVLNTITDDGNFIKTQSKYASCDHRQYDEILNYFEQQGLKPIVNTYKPMF